MSWPDNTRAHLLATRRRWCSARSGSGRPWSTCRRTRLRAKRRVGRGLGVRAPGKRRAENSSRQRSAQERSCDNAHRSSPFEAWRWAATPAPEESKPERASYRLRGHRSRRPGRWDLCQIDQCFEDGAGRFAERRCLNRARARRLPPTGRSLAGSAARARFRAIERLLAF